jgi:hypothetical protein
MLRFDWVGVCILAAREAARLRGNPTPSPQRDSKPDPSFGQVQVIRPVRGGQLRAGTINWRTRIDTSSNSRQANRNGSGRCSPS